MLGGILSSEGGDPPGNLLANTPTVSPRRGSLARLTEISVPRISPQSVYYLAYPVILAVGWAITWVNTRRTESVKMDMMRLMEQLREFYGPLQSIAAATQSSHRAMIQQFLEQRADPQVVLPNGFVENGNGKVGSLHAKEKLLSAVEEARVKQEQQRKEWHAALEMSTEGGVNPAALHYRTWATEVFQPLNERALEILIKRADLMDNTSVPPVFRQFAAHVLAFRTLIARWKSGDFSQRRCTIRYPEEFGPYVAYEFRRLKIRQAAQLHSLGSLQQGGTFLQWTGLSSVQMKDMPEKAGQPASGGQASSLQPSKSETERWSSFSNTELRRGSQSPPDSPRWSSFSNTELQRRAPDSPLTARL